MRSSLIPRHRQASGQQTSGCRSSCPESLLLQSATSPRALGNTQIAPNHLSRRSHLLGAAALVISATRSALSPSEASSETDRIAAAAPDSRLLLSASPRDRVLHLLSNGSTFYEPAPELANAVADLIESNPEPGPVEALQRQGLGTWEVFYAPHISRMSSLLQTKFTIRYILEENDAIYSNVKYSSPIFGSGWLSASGSLVWLDQHTTELQFVEFWMDELDDLRPRLQEGGKSKASDGILGRLGRLFFFEGLAKFPVLYLDDGGLTVFRFPPLRSNIAAKRI